MLNITESNKMECNVGLSPIRELHTPYGIITGPESAILYVKELIDDDVNNALKDLTWLT